MKLKLNNKYSFGIKPDKQRIRLIVFEDGSEFVCRKESKKKLIQFLDSPNDHIFKGQLQLLKKESNISVTVRGEIKGVINKNDFLNLINNVSN